MLSGVSVMYLRIYQEWDLISYHKQKTGKNVFPAYLNVPTSFIFSHTLILTVEFCRKMEGCK